MKENLEFQVQLLDDVKNSDTIDWVTELIEFGVVYVVFVYDGSFMFDQHVLDKFPELQFIGGNEAEVFNDQEGCFYISNTTRSIQGIKNELLLRGFRLR